MLPIVAIVGRPNVGKSTLFNRISGRQVALVNKIAGVTRDRHYGETEWLGHPFSLIDTGGIVVDEKDDMTNAIRQQTEYAIREAHLLLFVIDVRDNITSLDQDIALLLRKSGKTVVLVANKAEALNKIQELSAFYALGFGEPFWISAEHGQGIGDLLDAVLANLPPAPQQPPAAQGIQVAIVGRPNVGKSSLINCLLREDRLLVDATPGTTRDAIDSDIRVNKKLYTLIDTAGMRKARRIEEHLEKATVAITLKRIQQCDVALLVLDATARIGEQDIQVATYIERYGKACVFLINKWDAIDKDTRTYELLIQDMKTKIHFLSHAPTLSLSALTGQRVSKIFPLIDQVYAESQRRISTTKLNDAMKEVTRTNPPPAYRDKFVKFSFFLQSSTQPPTFLCFANYPQGVTRHYQRYLENQIRAHFGFAGTPIKLYFRPKRPEKELT